MAVIKCKMCGGDLDISEGLSVCECEYCGTKQTVPAADSEKKLTLFARANRLRLANEFDKAAGVYETIVADFPEEAEAYWGLVLCKYGIEYVDDPATGKKIPTCHRVSFDSVMEDSDFEQACENADAIARRQYREEAKAFEDIRRGIIEVSGKEAPYDIFICYKETAEDGNRTVDSVIAQDVYDALTDKGYRVFFSRISLEDKLGTEYEPYIFAALNSAKIMLAFGTDYEYYNAVWVKNEWSRFLKLMEKDKSKHLIPCYKNLDPYDMPKEFQRLQGQDMGKVGAVQDLLRGIEKILPGKAENRDVSAAAQLDMQGGVNVLSLLKRGQMFLEDRNWKSADEYFDKVLDINPENAEAYLGKLLGANRQADMNGLTATLANKIRQDRLFARFRQFASEEQLRRAEDALQAAVDDNAQSALDASMMARFAMAEKSAWNGSVYLTAQGELSSADPANPFTPEAMEKLVRLDQNLFNDVGLLSDGTVIAQGNNDDGECDVSAWTDIVSVAVGEYHTVGLKRDGTVVAVGQNEGKQCDVGGWHDIVAVAAGYHTVGLRSDGTVMATGRRFRQGR